MGPDVGNNMRPLFYTKMKSFLKAALALLLVSAGLAAQSQSESSLFRGRKSIVYRFAYNGTYFWDSPRFERGDVFYNGKLYPGVFVNIDAASDQLLVKPDEEGMTISPDAGQVYCFTKGDRVYVNLRRLGVENVPDGFYEVLSGGKGIVYRRVHKTLYTREGDHNGAEIGYEDPNYRPEVLTYFNFEETFYGEKDGEIVPLKVRRNRAAELRRHPASPEELFSRADAAEYLSGNYPVVEKKLDFKGDAILSTLPAGYFTIDDERTNAEMLRLLREQNTIAEYQNKVYEIGKGSASRAKVTGQVLDVSTLEPIAGVTVYDDLESSYATTDAEGFYSITLPGGENALNFKEYSKDDMHIRIVVRGDGSLDVMMKEKVTALTGAMVTGESMAKHRTTAIGLEKISIKTIGRIPTAFGEGDILKAVMTLPGVKSVGEASGGFNVRGGSTDQNLILFNGGTVYNPTHMFGIFSAFNPDVVSGVELYKSSIPAEFGGRVSSVLQVDSRDGSFDKFHANLAIGVLTSRASIEAPIVKGKTSFLLGGRTTYSDWILRALPSNSNYAGGSANFNDVNLGITHKFNDKHVIRAYAYWSGDRFSFSRDTSFRYNNLNVSLKYQGAVGDRSTLSVSGGYDSYGNRLYDSGIGKSPYEINTAIAQGHLKAAFKTRLERHTLNYGLDALYIRLNPGTQAFSSGEGDLSLPLQTSVQPALYLSDLWEIGDRLSLDFGARFSSAYNPDDKSFHCAPEGRISLKYSPQSNFSLKAGFNNISQYIHLISNSSSISPMDTWQLACGKVKPLEGWQAAGGVYWTVAGGALDISLEGYWKSTRNALDYKSGAKLVMNGNLIDDLVNTRGKAYGAELMLRKPFGKLNGWISYTYSRTFLQEMTDRGISTISGGKWYCAPYDKPHDLKVVANYEITHRFSFSANLDYSTGRPVTIPTSKYYYGGEEKLLYTDRNAYRLPDYFRLDLAFNIEPTHRLKAFTHASFTIGCYNVTGRKNAYSVYYNAAGSTVRGHMISVFACPVPYVNLNLKF